MNIFKDCLKKLSPTKESLARKAEAELMKTEPGKLDLIKAPSPILSTICPDQDIDWTYDRLVMDRLVELMLSYDGKSTKWLGVGMAAPQIGIRRRYFCMTPLKKNRELDVWRCFAPRIVSHGRDIVPMNEGCLSYQNKFVPINRYRVIEVIYNDEDKNIVRRTLKGWEARIFQHEIDHLNGKVCVENGGVL